VLAPDLERVFNLTGGNIFQGAMTPGQLFAFRPVPGHARYRTPTARFWVGDACAPRYDAVGRRRLAHTWLFAGCENRGRGRSQLGGVAAGESSPRRRRLPPTSCGMRPAMSHRSDGADRRPPMIIIARG
jgi:hypothetical protein